jgi:hypothetical protein
MEFEPFFDVKAEAKKDRRLMIVKVLAIITLIVVLVIAIGTWGRSHMNNKTADSSEVGTTLRQPLSNNGSSADYKNTVAAINAQQAKDTEQRARLSAQLANEAAASANNLGSFSTTLSDAANQAQQALQVVQDNQAAIATQQANSQALLLQANQQKQASYNSCISQVSSSQVISAGDALTKATAQLSAFMQQVNTPGGYYLPGQSASQATAYINNQITIYQNNVTNAQNYYNNAESQYQNQTGACRAILTN